MMNFFFFLLLVFMSSAFAQVPAIFPQYPTEKALVVPGETPPEEISPIENAVRKTRPYKPTPTPELKELKVETEETKLPEETKRTSATNRENSFGTMMVGYQPVTTWMPSKKVLSYTQIFNADWSLEFEYAWSTLSFPVVGVDLGSISEKRYSLLARYFVGNSFHFAVGPFLNKFDVELGPDFKDGSGQPLNESFRISAAGLAVGMGNRWLFDSGFTFGIDWLRLNIPVTNLKSDAKVLDDLSDDDADDIRDVINAFNRIPNFSILGIHLGYTF